MSLHHRVKLLRDVYAEGVHIPAGTIVEVERRYPNTIVGGLDLRYRDASGVYLFWRSESDVEDVGPSLRDVVQEAIAQARRYDDKLNGGPNGEGSRPPTGDDYNELFSIIMALETAIKEDDAG